MTVGEYEGMFLSVSARRLCGFDGSLLTDLPSEVTYVKGRYVSLFRFLAFFFSYRSLLHIIRISIIETIHAENFSKWPRVILLKYYKLPYA